MLDNMADWPAFNKVANAPVRYRAEHGVVGRIEQCNGSFCRIKVGKREGYIAQHDIWGVSDGEVLDD